MSKKVPVYVSSSGGVFSKVAEVDAGEALKLVGDPDVIEVSEILILSESTFVEEPERRVHIFKAEVQ